jgi:DNA-binding GntR family transcriptional regulator
MSSTATPPNGEPNKLEPLGRQAYRVLRRAIRNGIIRADRRYSEAELAKLLGVSRTPVREALKALERDGVLEPTTRKGYQLRTFDEGDVAELVVLRKLLERLTVSTLAQQAQPEDISKLEAAVERQAEHVDEPEQMVVLDEEFHLLIADLANLSRTGETLAGLRSAMAIILSGTRGARTLSDEVVGEHRTLVAAIADGDPDRAAAIVEEHIEHATRPLLEAARARRAQTEALRLTIA